MFDYSELAETALELTTEFGRSITLIAHSSSVDDSAKPWRGTTNPRTTPSASLAVPAVFVEPSSATRLGLSVETTDFLKRCTQIAIVASTADLKIYNELIDTDSTYWKIEGMEQLKPAGTTLVYFIGVSR